MIARIAVSLLAIAGLISAQGDKRPLPAVPADGPTRIGAPDYAKRPNPAQPIEASVEDLNSLRDTNVRRVTKTGCPPEVTMRIAELKTKLGVNKAAAASGTATDLADRWHQRGPAPAENANAEKDRLLEWALGIRSGPKRDGDSTESQKLEAELQRLAVSCPEAR